MAENPSDKMEPVSLGAHNATVDLFLSLRGEARDKETEGAILEGMVAGVSEILWRGFTGRSIEQAAQVMSKSIAEHLTAYAAWDRSHSGELN